METYPEDIEWKPYWADVLADNGYSQCACGEYFHKDKIRGGDDYSPFENQCLECGSIMEAW